jgi:hypothetical protein
LGLGKEAIGGLEGLDNDGLPGSSVNLDDLALREWMGMNFVAATVFGTVRSIVV